MISVASRIIDDENRRPLLLERLSAFIERRMGLFFPRQRLTDLERAIRAAAGEFGFDSLDSCIEWLLSTPLSPKHIEILAGHLTVGETYFFRNNKVFEIIESQILPEIVRSHRGREKNLRIWSAGCSTGEEPYSLAILLARSLPDLQDWNITILATDITPSSLKRAYTGVYGEWSFRDTPRWVKTEYFVEKHGRLQGKFEIAPLIKRMVTFSHLNLAEDPYPAILNNTNAMDIIFCRNVLMYFSSERARAVIADLSRCLVDGGWFVTSAVESPGPNLPPLLHPVHFPATILFRKGPQSGVQAPRPGAPPPSRPKTERKTAAAACNQPGLRVFRPVPPPPIPESESPATGTISVRARLLADQGKLADALALCETALSADKLDPASHYLQATILQEMGKAKEAASALQRAIYLDQDFALAHFSLGHLLQRRGKAREAGKHLHKARQLFKSYAQDEVLPESEGISAGRLIELIDTMLDIGYRR